MAACGLLVRGASPGAGADLDDRGDPPPEFWEADLVAHGGVSVSDSFIQTLTMVDVVTGWTECFPLLVREARRQ